MSHYSVRDQRNSTSGEPEYVVVNSAGVAVSPPNTFRNKQDAISRQEELEKKRDLQLAQERASRNDGPGCSR